MSRNSPPPSVADGFGPSARQSAALEVFDDLEAFTVEEVARRLRLSVDSVRDRIADGRLGCIRDGDGPRPAIRVLPSQLQKYLNDRRVD